MTNEIWKDIPEYSGIYQVSNLGRVRSLDRQQIHHYTKLFVTIKGRVIPGSLSKKGYPVVTLTKKSKRKTFMVHRLVMITFCGVSELQVDHINGIKTDNRLENLRYCTNRENISFYYQSKQSSSNHIGVNKMKTTSSKKFRAQIKIDNKLIHLGVFENEIDAAIAYQNKLSSLQSLSA